METDRNVSEYMQRKNVQSTNLARLIAAQLLITAVFFLAYLFLQNTRRFGADLEISRVIVKGVLIILSLLLSLVGIIVSYKSSGLHKYMPDTIGIRQSHDIIDAAYDVAKPALIFRMTFALVLFMLGGALALVTVSIMGAGENSTYIGKAIFFVFLAGCALMFVPAFDRMNVYKMLLNEKHDIMPRYSFAATGIAFSILMPASFCAYYLWRFFGNDRSIAWIVFPIAVIILGAVIVLADYVREPAD